MSDEGADYDWGLAERDLDGFDTTASLMTRLWNLWAGGQEALPGDRGFCDRAREVYPPITMLARYRLVFRARVVRALLAEHGVEQFLVAGADLPMHSEVHDIAHRAAPGARVVYADSDALVMRIVEALLTPELGRVCGYVYAGLDDPAALLEEAARWLDLNRPVGVLILNSLDTLPDPLAAAALEALGAAVAPGSCLAISALTDDGGTRLVEALGAGRHPTLARPRSRAELQGFFAGTRLLPPGIVPVSCWRPELALRTPATQALWCGVGEYGGPGGRPKTHPFLAGAARRGQGR
ncbi:SAM-dependent methyltransferase [Actinomadura litoris]|uniref:SAM-dependent methyltransferase n=1 Tax=Actinomadura litoris TaxID=2678616 RepID=UPI001FA6CAED|nr:SAM-dependent methyltransferase [Actinomadura litoris]